MDRRTFLTTSGLAVAGAGLIPAQLFAQGTSGDASANEPTCISCESPAAVAFFFLQLPPPSPVARRPN